MTERQQQIATAILRFLDRLDGAQAAETVIHASAQTTLRNAGEPAPSLAEFQDALLVCDQRGWVTGIVSRLTKQMKWSLSDLGRAALRNSND
jgi:hypothetical protein